MRGALVFSLVLLAGCSSRSDPALPEETSKLASLSPEIRDAARALAGGPLFAATGTSADAGPRLNPLVPWGQTATAALSLPEPFLDVLGEHTDTTKLDFSWMKRLADFDHWRFQADARWSDPVPFSFIHAGAPDWFMIARWGRLRLLDGSRRGDLPAARREVEALARLMTTTESVLAIRAAANMLDVQVDAYLNGKLGLASFVAPTAVLAAHLADTTAPGYCAFMTEVLWRAYYLRPHLGRATPTVRSAYAAYDAIVTDPNNRCAWPMLRAAWAERGTRGRFLDPFTDRENGLTLDARSEEIVAQFFGR